MVDLKKFSKKILRLGIQIIIIGSTTFLLFELCFRSYLIDFYKGEFKYLNASFEDRDTDKSLLIIGDSFSTFKDGYSKILYDSVTSHNLRNYSISGTSIREQHLFGKYHIKKHNPNILVFQFYVGNDLFSWDHPSASTDISFLRNTYWHLSEHVWSLNFINHSLSGLRAKHNQVSFDSILSKRFDPDKFSYRDMLYFKAEPDLIENTAYLKHGRRGALKSYMDRMKELFTQADANCEIYILMVPHASQVNKVYLDRTKELGAVFSPDFEVGQNHYPLFDEMVSFFSNDGRIKVLNPITELKQEEEQGEEVYLTNDSHLTLGGQQVLGEFLLSELKKGCSERAN